MEQPQDFEQQTNPEYITDCLRKQAREHVDRSNGHLRILDNDPEHYPEQVPQTTFIDSTPLTAPKLFENITEHINSRFPLLLADLKQHEPLLKDMGKALNNNENLVPATNHNDITDVAYALGAYSIVLKQRGYEFETSTIVGKMITHLGLVTDDSVIPLTTVLRLGCDRVYFNYPDTDSTLNAGVPEAYAKNHNARMVLRGLLPKLHQGRQLLGIAPSASTGGGLPHLKRVEDGTISLLSRKSIWVAPTAIWMASEVPLMQPTGELLKVESETDVHAFMTTIAAVLSDSPRVPDIFSYASDSDKTPVSSGR